MFVVCKQIWLVMILVCVWEFSFAAENNCIPFGKEKYSLVIVMDPHESFDILEEMKDVLSKAIPLNDSLGYNYIKKVSAYLSEDLHLDVLRMSVQSHWRGGVDYAPTGLWNYFSNTSVSRTFVCGIENVLKFHYYMDTGGCKVYTLVGVPKTNANVHEVINRILDVNLCRKDAPYVIVDFKEYGKFDTMYVRKFANIKDVLLINYSKLSIHRLKKKFSNFHFKF
jgi:hypothetical protein